MPSGVDERVDARVAERLRDHVAAGVVIVVAEDRRDAVARLEVRELSGDQRRVSRIEIDEVSGRDDEVRADLGDAGKALGDLALSDVAADVNVGDLRDRVAVEDAREAGDFDDELVDLEGVTAA